MNTKIDYLRLSITDKCNLNCIYCTPVKKSRFLPRDEILSYEEMSKLVELFVNAGIRKVRLTGGEPLIKKEVIKLVSMLKNINGLEEITLTTNGVYLKSLATQLKNVGIDRINISLNTLQKEKYKYITGTDYFNDVLAGIEESIAVGFQPLKLNVVLLKGINDNEISDFVELTSKYPIIVRFIEFFVTNSVNSELSGSLVQTKKVKEMVTTNFGELEKISGVRGNGPAEYYKIKESVIGFISNSSKNFCDKCNRLRIDCTGKISPCLFSRNIYNIAQLLRDNTISETEILNYIQDILKSKPEYNKNTNYSLIEMSSIGG